MAINIRPLSPFVYLKGISAVLTFTLPNMNNFINYTINERVLANIGRYTQNQILIIDIHHHFLCPRLKYTNRT